MSKRLANILLPLCQPPLLDLRYFLDVMQRWQNASVEQARQDPVHGALFRPTKKASGSKGCERAGITSLLQFADLCLHQAAPYPTLDAFFVAWGQWVLHPSQLFDTSNNVCNKPKTSSKFSVCPLELFGRMSMLLQGRTPPRWRPCRITSPLCPAR